MKLKPASLSPAIDPRWLGLGLKAAFAFNEGAGPPRDALAGLVGALSSSDWSIGASGRVIVHDATGDRTDIAADSSVVLPSGPCTIVLGYQKTDGTNRASGAFGVDTATAAEYCAVKLPDSDGIVYWDYGGVTDGTTRLTAPSLTFGEDTWAFTVGPRGMEIWQNGQRRASNAANPTRTPSTAALKLGLYDSSVASDLAELNCFYVFAGQLSSEDIQLLTNDPAALFLTQTSRLQTTLAAWIGGSLSTATAFTIFNEGRRLRPSETSVASRALKYGFTDDQHALAATDPVKYIYTDEAHALAAVDAVSRIYTDSQYVLRALDPVSYVYTDQQHQLSVYGEPYSYTDVSQALNAYTASYSFADSQHILNAPALRLGYSDSSHDLKAYETAYGYLDGTAALNAPAQAYGYTDEVHALSVWNLSYGFTDGQEALKAFGLGYGFGDETYNLNANELAYGYADAAHALAVYQQAYGYTDTEHALNTTALAYGYSDGAHALNAYALGYGYLDGQQALNAYTLAYHYTDSVHALAGYLGAYGYLDGVNALNTYEGLYGYADHQHALLTSGLALYAFSDSQHGLFVRELERGWLDEACALNVYAHSYGYADSQAALAAYIYGYGYTDAAHALNVALGQYGYLDAQHLLDCTGVAIGWVLNAASGAASRYEGYELSSLAKGSHAYLGAASDGIYTLEGTTDNGTEIGGFFVTGDLDFGTDRLKRLTDVYLAVEGGTEMTVKATPSGGETYSYTLKDHGDRKPRKAHVGRGLKGRYFRLEVANAKGSDFKLSSMSVLPEILSRRG